MEKSAEIIDAPQKKVIISSAPKRHSSKAKIKTSGSRKHSGLKTDAAVLAGAIGVTAAAVVGFKHDQIEDVARHVEGFRPQGVVEAAKESIGAKYSKLLRPGESRPEIKIAAAGAEKPTDADVELLYQGLSSEDLQEFDTQLKYERSVIRNYYMPEVTEQNLSTLLPLIKQYADDGGVPENILIGMIVIESKFEPLKFNEDSGAKGLTQEVDAMARAHNMQISGADVTAYNYDPSLDLDDRYLPEKILPSTVEELKDAYQRWENWGFALWEWHAGSVNIYDFLQIYMKDKYHEDLPSIKGKDAEESLMIKQLYKDKIVEQSITVFDVVNNLAVAGELSAPGMDQTARYTLLALAAIKEYEAKYGKEGVVDKLRRLPKSLRYPW